jgi:hypothetical protein
MPRCRGKLQHHGRFARTAAQVRDRGIAGDAAKTTANNATPEGAGRDMEIAIITVVYGHRELSPDEIAAQTLEGCMQGLSR